MTLDEEEIRRLRTEATLGAVVGTLFGDYAQTYGIDALVLFERDLMGRLLPVLAKTLSDPMLVESAARQMLAIAQQINDVSTPLRVVKDEVER